MLKNRKLPAPPTSKAPHNKTAITYIENHDARV
jgi:hypothetical protein